MPIEFSTLDPALATAAAKIAESRKGIQAHPPELLFHYTNAKGLLGIAGSSRLWATNYRFLNDSSEIAYGVSLLESVVSDRLAKSENDVVTEFLRRSLSSANAFDGMIDCFVACFCESNELLHQWRMYSSSGGGFAVGFQARMFNRRSRQDHIGQDCFLRKIVYDESNQRALLAEVVDLAIHHLAEGTKGPVARTIAIRRTSQTTPK